MRVFPLDGEAEIEAAKMMEHEESRAENDANDGGCLGIWWVSS